MCITVKVAINKPEKMTYYLNITLRNIVFKCDINLPTEEQVKASMPIVRLNYVVKPIVQANVDTNVQPKENTNQTPIVEHNVQAIVGPNMQPIVAINVDEIL
ncbi:hypothetical protein DEO72_LG8g1732 [Vigna unguiculata]|uniref:Uncharacterized protein n=1 Tax=Vigna unguiculata TaxID=3917 RepID=A0A4D6MUY0_VIGUN|nr:hypothetical protein DEO72_LG8g1732 [Vigna unguiculata]